MASQKVEATGTAEKSSQRLPSSQRDKEPQQQHQQRQQQTDKENVPAESKSVSNSHSLPLHYWNKPAAQNEPTVTKSAPPHGLTLPAVKRSLWYVKGSLALRPLML